MTPKIIWWIMSTPRGRCGCDFFLERVSAHDNDDSHTHFPSDIPPTDVSMSMLRPNESVGLSDFWFNGPNDQKLSTAD